MTSESDLKNYYNDRYARDGDTTMRPPEAYDIFLEHLDSRSNATLLDVACGTGYLLRAARKRGLQTFGIRYIRTSCRHSKKNSPPSEIHVASGESIPFEDNTFQFVFILQKVNRAN